MTKPFAELSVVRLRKVMTNDQGQTVAAGTTGTIVHVQPTGPGEEPAYIVEVVPNTAGLNLIDAHHGDLSLLKPFVSDPKTPWLSGILFAGACLFGIMTALSIAFCADLIRTGSGWGSIGFIFYGAPFLVILPTLLIALPSGILFKRGHRRLDLASLLISCATVLVTLIEVAILFSADLHGC